MTHRKRYNCTHTAQALQLHTPPKQYNCIHQEAEDDPLEAFMAGISAEVAAQAQQPSAPPRGERNEDADHVADFLDAWEQGQAAVAAPAATGYTSDDEVRAAAAAAAAQEEPGPRGMELLPPVDHAAVDYPAFAKALYEVFSYTKLLSVLCQCLLWHTLKGSSILLCTIGAHAQKAGWHHCHCVCSPPARVHLLACAWRVLLCVSLTHPHTSSPSGAS